MEPMVYILAYMFNHFYLQYLVLLTVAPRSSINSAGSIKACDITRGGLSTRTIAQDDYRITLG